MNCEHAIRIGYLRTPLRQEKSQAKNLSVIPKHENLNHLYGPYVPTQSKQSRYKLKAESYTDRNGYG